MFMFSIEWLDGTVEDYEDAYVEHAGLFLRIWHFIRETDEKTKLETVPAFSVKRIIHALQKS